MREVAVMTWGQINCVTPQRLDMGPISREKSKTWSSAGKENDGDSGRNNEGAWL